MKKLLVFLLAMVSGSLFAGEFRERPYRNGISITRDRFGTIVDRGNGRMEYYALQPDGNSVRTYWFYGKIIGHKKITLAEHALSLDAAYSIFYGAEEYENRKEAAKSLKLLFSKR